MHARKSELVLKDIGKFLTFYIGNKSVNNAKLRRYFNEY